MITNSHIQFTDKLISVLLYHQITVTGIAVSNRFTTVHTNFFNGLLNFEYTQHISNKEILNMSVEHIVQKSATNIIDSINRIKTQMTEPDTANLLKD